jgi:DNA-binding NarL/FixJ family response regulator
MSPPERTADLDIVCAYYSNVTIRVLIADPQPFFCESLAAALEGLQVDVVAWTTDEVDASALVSSNAPDVLLTEVDLDAGSGLSLTRRLRDGTKTVVLTRRHEGDVLLDAVAAGALGCVGHDVAVDKLAILIGQAADGRFAVQADRLHETLRRAVARRTNEGPVSAVARLTGREREVLALLASGLDNDEIAGRLYLSPTTVRTHIGNILRKLEVHSRADAVRIAVAAGEGRDARERVLHITGPELAGR